MKNFPQLIEIKRLRKKLGITQKKLGEELNIPQSTISRIENGSIDPPYSKIKILYEYLENKRKEREKMKKQAEDIMSNDIIFIKPNSSIRDAVDLMNKHGISQLPILEQQQNLGSLTSKKIQKFITENPKIMNGDVSLIKGLPFPEVNRDWGIKDVSKLLENYPAVLVKDENYNFIGIITDADLLKLTKNYKMDI
ncbi:MAG: CBS domain-containing protein [Promethearchaeota archaeon]